MIAALGCLEYVLRLNVHNFWFATTTNDDVITLRHYIYLCVCVHSLLLKVCQTLKNRSREVRDVGRGTLVKMATALGPRYLQYIVKEMRDALDRGYMVRGVVCWVYIFQPVWHSFIELQFKCSIFPNNMHIHFLHVYN